MGRRREDRYGWVVQYWPIIAFVIVWTLTGVVWFAHLEWNEQHMLQRMNYHWGTEW